MRGEPSTVEVNVVVTEFLQIANALMATAGRRVHLTRPRVSADSTARTAHEIRWRSTRPFHEAVDRRARRARHSRQVFGLIIGLLRASQAEPQRDALDRMLVLGTLLEGHADHVMDAVGPAVVPSVATIRAAFDKRRQRKSNPVQRIIKMLLGMDAKMAQYVRGKAFVDAVVLKVGMEQFNTIWTGPETLPLLDEIARLPLQVPLVTEALKARRNAS